VSRHTGYPPHEPPGFVMLDGSVRIFRFTDARVSNLGFDRNDLSSVHRDRLPLINEKGMCLQYAVTHEDFAWGVRGEPGVVEAFEKVYNDKDLLVSFDAINFTFPK
jgi:hypothetical protein